MDPVERLASNYEYPAEGPYTKVKWIFQTLGSKHTSGLGRPRGHLGASSLYDLAFRYVLRHLSLFDSESFVGVPWSCASAIWKAVCKHQLDSFAIWKAFVVAYPEEEDSALKHRYKVLKYPAFSFEHVILKPINSASFQWINFLTITTVKLSRLDLLQLPKLSNLGALTIGPGGAIGRRISPNNAAERDYFDIDIVRAWAYHCTEAGAFGQLRVLVLRSVNTVDARIFQYLNSFPLLSIFGFQDCWISHGDKPDASKFNWGYDSTNKITQYLFQGKLPNDNQQWDIAMQILFHWAITDELQMVKAKDRSKLSLNGAHLRPTANVNSEPTKVCNPPQMKIRMSLPMEELNIHPVPQPRHAIEDVPKLHLVLGADPVPVEQPYGSASATMQCFLQETRIKTSEAEPSKQKTVVKRVAEIPSKEDAEPQPWLRTPRSPVNVKTKRALSDKTNDIESSTKRPKKLVSKYVDMEDTLAQFGSRG